MDALPRAPTSARVRTYADRVVASHQQAADMLLETRLRMCQHGDARRRDMQFKAGDSVWLSASGITLPAHRDRKCQKLTPVYYGPYDIVERISAVSYRLKLPVNLKIHDVFHIQRLKAATLDEFKGRKRRKMPAIREDVYEVEELLKNRVVRGKEQYLVKWKGFSLGHSSWEPVSNLRCPRLLQQYREEQD